MRTGTCNETHGNVRTRRHQRANDQVHLIVDDCEARLGEEGVAAVIEVVGSMLYKAPPPPDEAAEGEL